MVGLILFLGGVLPEVKLRKQGGLTFSLKLVSSSIFLCHGGSNKLSPKVVQSCRCCCQHRWR